MKDDYAAVAEVAEVAHNNGFPDVGALGYEPLSGAWICDEHGVAECAQTEHCRALPWKATEDVRLWPFMDWARDQFDTVIAPYDRGEVTEMPDEAFDAYFVDDWLDLPWEWREARRVQPGWQIRSSGVWLTVRAVLRGRRWVEFHAEDGSRGRCDSSEAIATRNVREAKRAAVVMSTS